MESSACANSQKKNQQRLTKCCRVIKKTIRSHVVQLKSQGKNILMCSLTVAMLALLVTQMQSTFDQHRQQSRNPNPWSSAFHNMMRSFWEQTLQKLWDVLRFLVITTCIGYGILNSSGWNSSEQNAGNVRCSKYSAQICRAGFNSYGDKEEEDMDSDSSYVNLLDSKKSCMSYAAGSVDIIHDSINEEGEEEEEETEIKTESVLIKEINGNPNAESNEIKVEVAAAAASVARVDLLQEDEISAQSSSATDVEVNQKNAMDAKANVNSEDVISTNPASNYCANYASGCDSEYSADDESSGTFSSAYQYYYGSQVCTPLPRSGRLRRTQKHHYRLHHTNLAAAVTTSMALKHSEISHSEEADDLIIPEGLRRDRRAKSADCLFKEDVQEFRTAVDMEKLKMVGRTVSADESALRAAAASALAGAQYSAQNCYNYNSSILLSGRTASADEAGLRAAAAAAMATAGTTMHKSSSSGNIFEELEQKKNCGIDAEKRHKKSSRSALNLTELVKSRSRRSKHNFLTEESAENLNCGGRHGCAAQESEILLRKKNMIISDAKKSLRDSLVPWRSAATGSASSSSASVSSSGIASSSASSVSSSSIAAGTNISADLAGNKSPVNPNITASPGRVELNKKADDFIARFHQRMRLQRLESLERRRNAKK